MKQYSRRHFMGTGLGTLGAALAVGDDSGAGWIDAHVHVWTPETSTYPISDNFAEKEMNPPSFLPSELFAIQDGSGVDRTVLVQMSFYEFDNSFMLDAMANFPGRFGGIGIVDEREKIVGMKMKRLAERGVRGFRLYAFPDRVKNWDNSPGIASMWKTGADEGLAMCCLTNPEVLPVIRRMCQRYPETPVVIDHFARVGISGTIDESQLGELLGLAEFANVHVKTSAFYALGKKAPPYDDLAPMFRQVRDAFGADRLMWGSDCPYQVQGEHTYGASLSLVTERLDFLSTGERDLILRGTAEKLFFS